MENQDIKFDILYDKSFRQSLRDNPHKYAEELGYKLDDSVEIVVKTNSKDTTYIPLAMEGNIDLDNINAAGALGCVSSVGCASTAATITSSVSSGGTAGSVGTASTT